MRIKIRDASGRPYRYSDDRIGGAAHLTNPIDATIAASLLVRRFCIGIGLVLGFTMLFTSSEEIESKLFGVAFIIGACVAWRLPIRTDYPPYTPDRSNPTCPVCNRDLSVTITYAVLCTNCDITWRKPQPHCLRCGYDMTGTSMEQCPECAHRRVPVA